MAQAEDSDLVVPSIFDRLSSEGEQPLHTRSHAQLLRELRRSVMRDVAHLLNTRRRAIDSPPELTELSQSNLGYGIPDITGGNFNSPNALEEFRRIVEDTLRRYEPRFQSVRVRLLANAFEADSTVRFRIDAMLRAEPAPEPIVFDSIMEPVLCNFEVRGAAR